MFKVEWTGSYPCLCLGQWIIKKDGVDVSDTIPVRLRIGPMNTFKTYRIWHFDKDWMEVWEDHKDGLPLTKWIAENSWISNICNTYAEKVELFEAIKEKDWRYESCGGCI